MRKWMLLLLLTLPACRGTVGVSKSPGGFAEISPAVASEMLLDSNQVVLIDVRPGAAFHGPDGHIPHALNAPFDSIDRRLPELLPYQGQTVLVYGETSTDGMLAAKFLIDSGFRNVVLIDGGIRYWIERHYLTVQ